MSDDKIVSAIVDPDADGIYKGSAHAVPPDLPPVNEPISTGEPTKSEDE